MQIKIHKIIKLNYPSYSIFAMFHFRRNPFLNSINFHKVLLNKQHLILNYQLKSLFSSLKNKKRSQQKVSSPEQQNLNASTNPTLSNTQYPEPKQFTPEQQSLIKTYQPDEIFNTVLNLDPKHNFQKDLILAKKSYQKSTKQLRASILFQDLLKSEVQLPIYDTKGKPYTHMWMKNLFNMFFFGLIVWFFHSIGEKDSKTKVLLERTTTGKVMKSLMYGFASWFLLIGFWRYLKFQRRFVQKIIYDTKNENFFMTKRGFFGGKYQKEISRFKIVYTENEFLNKKGTNYFNLDTKQQYSIPYKQYWIKQDLFSHLIAQRIKL